MKEANLPLNKGVIAYILDENNNILISQNRNFGHNEWTFPGGGVDKGESVEEALRRELKEELSLKKDDIQIITTSLKPLEYEFSERYRDRVATTRVKKHRGQSKTQFYVKFVGEKNSIKLNIFELRQYKWAKIDELSKYLIFPNQLQETMAVLKEFGVI